MYQIADPTILMAESVAPGGPPDLLEPYDSQLALPSMDVLHAIGWPDRSSADEMRTVGVTSCGRGEGVSTIALHLAATAASCGRGPVLLVDCNVVRPALHAMLHVPLSPGLAACTHSVDTAMAAIRRSPIPDLFVLPAGELRGSPAKLYSSTVIGELIQRVADEFDLTIFDLPSAGQASCLGQIAGRLDGVVLIIEAGRVTHEVARSAKTRLELAGARVIGGVLNHRNGQRED
jgi:Mrp family chromosome partitioning ATPase